MNNISTTNTNDNTKIKKFLIPILILAAVTAAVYFGNYYNHYGYYYDYKEIVSNEYVNPSVTDVKTLFTKLESFHFYVPLKHLANYVLNHFSFLNPHISHLFSDFLHIFNVILCYLLIIKLSKSYRVAFLTALMFAVSPVGSNAVNEIAARGHLFTAFFGMLSFYMYILSDTKGLKKNQDLFFVALAVVFYIIGLFFWTTIIVLPLLFVIYEFIKDQRLTAKRISLRISPFLSKAFGILLITVYASYLSNKLQAGIAFDNSLVFSLNLFGWESFYKIPTLIANYITYCFVPPSFDIIFAPPLPDLFQAPLKYILAFAVLALYSYACVYIYKKDKSLIPGVAIFAVFLLPGLIFMHKAEPVSLRYMYPASMGIFFMVFVLLENLVWNRSNVSKALKITCVCILAGWFVFAATNTYLRKYDWKNPETVTNAMIKSGNIAEVWGWFLKTHWETDNNLNKEYLLKAKEALEKNKNCYNFQCDLIDQNITERSEYIDALNNDYELQMTNDESKTKK
ncbi:MAG: hypothetical protein FWF00_00815 [Endomicrobia bacterium]|nr:hypothetical protein [Endomicrobiia bacterium]MCL2506216.1 hypothetical protein [Endomicrobiia bacterium]